MSSTEQPRNLAARMGRWSAGHRKLAILGWLAFVALALALGGPSARNSSPSTRPAPASRGT
jgi:uncharacterized membrane protein YdfJ with MMPL/SSD domain